MCGRYTVSMAREVLAGYLGVEASEDLVLPVYNACPGQYLPVILDVEPGRMVPALWGIRPVRPGARSRLLINARSETIDTRPAFRDAFQRRRCLAIADGFYEWRTTPEGKLPYRIVLASGEPFALAGIWEEVDGAPAFVILTTDANEVARPIHERMPVILEARETGPWLSRDLPLADVLKLLDPYPEDEMVAYRVSTAVNSSKNDDKGLIEPLEQRPFLP